MHVSKNVTQEMAVHDGTNGLNSSTSNDNLISEHKQNTLQDYREALQ